MFVKCWCPTQLPSFYGSELTKFQRSTRKFVSFNDALCFDDAGKLSGKQREEKQNRPVFLN